MCGAMANKVSTDGADFQQHLYFYVLGLCHDKYEYSALYEGDDKTYGALGDVILEINADDSDKKPEALYLIQAKQFQNDDKQISIEDLLHPKDGFTKYIESYNTYTSSKAYHNDGPPTEMIYWTSIDLHPTTKHFMEVFQSNSATEHLKIPNVAETPIQKYRIKDWKKLFIFEIALRLANCAELNAKNNDDKKFKCESVAAVLVQEAVELVEVGKESGDSEMKLKFREEFLQRKSSLSEEAVWLRECFDLVYSCKGRKPDLGKLGAKIFDNVFGLGNRNLSAEMKFKYEYKGLNEEKLNWFFEHFIYYVKVPKGEKMISLLKQIFDGNFKEQLFKKHLIPKSTQKSKSFITKSDVDTIIQTAKLT